MQHRVKFKIDGCYNEVIGPYIMRWWNADNVLLQQHYIACGIVQGERPTDTGGRGRGGDEGVELFTNVE